MRVFHTYTPEFPPTHRTVQLSFLSLPQCFWSSAMPTLPSSQAGPATRGTRTPGTPTPAMYTGYERFPKPAPKVLPLGAIGNPNSSHTAPSQTREVTYCTHSTGCPSNSGTPEPPVANPRSSSQPCAAPLTPCCCRKSATMSSTSRTNSRCTRTRETWPSSDR